MRPSLAACHRVHFVDDHPTDAAQYLAGRRREDEIERFGCRYQDVGRVSSHPLSGIGWRVTGADEGVDCGQGRATDAARGVANSGQRRPEIPLDVMGQGLQGRDVEHAASTGLVRLGLGQQLIECPEECGQCLARPGGGVDQRVMAICDGGPAQGLGSGWLVERGLEPSAGCRGEGAERVHIGKVSEV